LRAKSNKIEQIQTYEQSHLALHSHRLLKALCDSTLKDQIINWFGTNTTTTTSTTTPTTTRAKQNNSGSAQLPIASAVGSGSVRMINGAVLIETLRTLQRVEPHIYMIVWMTVGCLRGGETATGRM